MSDLRDNKTDGQNNPDKLEMEVNQARARVEQRVGELSERLSPGELIDQALSMAREHGGEFGKNLASQVKQNPLPMILTGVGLSWLMISAKDTTHASYDYKADAPYPPDYDEHYREDYQDEEYQFDPVQKARTAIKDKAGALRHQAGSAAHKAREKAHTAQDKLSGFFYDQPLVAASLGVAIGAALGAIVPPSAMEDRLMGEISDKTVAKAKSAASGQYEKAREKVNESVKNLNDSVTDSSTVA